MAEGIGGGGGSSAVAIDADLFVDIGDVPLGRADAEGKFVRDFLVALARRDQAQDLDLTWR